MAVAAQLPLKGRVFKIASKSYAFFAYSIYAFDYQTRVRDNILKSK